MSQLEVPDDRFLLISIFGGSVQEYVDVAKAFFDDREAKFVNGILDAVAKDVGS